VNFNIMGWPTSVFCDPYYLYVTCAISSYAFSMLFTMLKYQVWDTH